jgi:hypothetical protein
VSISWLPVSKRPSTSLLRIEQRPKKRARKRRQNGIGTYAPNVAPPYDGQELGTDPTKCPGEGFEWRGKGTPESGQGGWYNPGSNETLHPDIEHAPPIPPHWDYVGPNEERARLFLDGTWTWN